MNNIDNTNTIETNFIMLKSLLSHFSPVQKGYLSMEEVAKIRLSLHLMEMDVLALRNLRDFVVIYISQLDISNKTDLISGITAVIDTEIWEKKDL